MKWFTDLRIRVKLLLSFIIVIVLTVVLAVVAAVSLNSVDSKYTYLLDYPNIRYNAMADAKYQLDVIRRSFIMFSVDKNSKSDLDTQYSNLKNALAALTQDMSTSKTNMQADEQYTDAQKADRLPLMDQVVNTCNDYLNSVVTPLYNQLAAGELAEEEIKAAFDRGATVMAPAIEQLDTLLASADKTMNDENVSTSAYAANALKILIVVAAVAALLALLLALYVAGVITKPITKLVDVANNIADGNLNINIDTSAKDETGQLSTAFSAVVQNINRIMSDIDGMYKNHEDGKMDDRIDSKAYKGSYKSVADGVNMMVNSYIDMVKDVLGTINDVANGDFVVKLQKYKGEKAQVNHDVNTVVATIKGISEAIADIAKKGGTDGNLAAREDRAKYAGEWANIIDELNALMDAFERGIGDMVKALQEFAKGNFSYRITNNYRGDFDSAKQATNSTAEEVDSYIAEVSNILEMMANGDLRRDITRDYIGQFTAIKNSINQIGKSLNGTMQEITSASGQVLTGARQISTSAMSLAQGATEQASAVQELNAMVDEINNQTQDNAQNAQQASKLAGASKNNAETGNDEMKGLLTAMEGITQSSNKISNIIKTIEDLASQTNLLALNAAVEAARAGEHGKGFTVVAGEVRSLAEKSRQAAQETNALIQESISRVNEGTKRANETAGSLEKIVGNVVDVSEVINKIYDASMRQQEAIGNVGIGLNQISQVVQSNSATSEESAAASQELNSQAETLQQMISYFKTK